MDTILDIKNDKRQWDEIVFETSSNLEVRKSLVHGRGVFTTNNIVSGDVIETFPLIPLMFKLRYIGDTQIVCNSIIHSTCPCDDCKKHGYSAYLAGGYGMFYNHQDQNNAVLHVNWDNLYAEVKASKVITPESEIFLDYGQNYPWSLTGVNKITLEEDQ
jgi:hypothetical protein